MSPDPAPTDEWTITLDVPPGYREDGRLDVYVARFLPNASRAKVQEGIRQGRVLVNGVAATKASHRVQAGDRIDCTLPRPPPFEAEPEPIPLSILFEDDHLIVLDKPAGRVVHPSLGHRSGTLVNALLHHVGAGPLSVEDADALDDDDVGLSTVNATPMLPGGLTVRPGIVHRLDKDTTGVMVVAKHDVAHRRLAAQFEARTIRRRYLALVWGVPDPPAGTIVGAIGRDRRERKNMAVVPDGQGKHAVTHYATVEPLRHTALLRFRLETGRTHQIRVHARHVGHPVLGDPRYDGQRIHAGPHMGKRRAFFRNLFEQMPRQALHAHTLGFDHPMTGEALDFEAPLPADMQHVLDRLRAVEG